MNIINLEILIKTASFYVLNTLTLFLLNLGNINKLNIYLNNLKNALIHMFNDKKVLVIRY